MNEAVTVSPEPFKLGSGKSGVLLIHGFTGSPAEVRGMGEFLAEHGYTVYGPLVPGHGTVATDMLRYSWQQWVAACGQALEDLRHVCDEVFVAGLSNGGLLALYLAATARPLVSGVISMSAPIYWRDWRMTVAPALKHVVRWQGKGAPHHIDPTTHERLWHYERFPTAPVTQMLALGREDRRLLPKLRAPLLVMQGRHDHTVDPGCADYIYQRAGSADKDLVYWDNSAHIITEDQDRHEVWQRALSFIVDHEKVGKLAPQSEPVLMSNH